MAVPMNAVSVAEYDIIRYSLVLNCFFLRIESRKLPIFLLIKTLHCALNEIYTELKHES